MIELAGQLVPLKLNTEREGKELAQKYGVRGLPTIVFLKPDGEAVHEIGGYLPPDKFAAQMKRALGKDGKSEKKPAEDDVAAIRKKLEKSPKNAELHAKLAAALAKAGELEEATQTLKTVEEMKYNGAALPDAYRAFGDHFQGKREFESAVDYFTRMEKVAKKPADKSYALMSQMDCYAALNDEEKARTAARAILKLKGAEEDHIRAANEYLDE